MGEIAKKAIGQRVSGLYPDRPDRTHGEWEKTPDRTPDRPRTGPCGPRTGSLEATSLAAENAILRAENARLRARIAQLEAPPLASLLGREMGATFRASDVIAEAQRQAREAGDEGRAIPELPAALAAAGIRDANTLGRYIGKSPLFEKCGSEGGKAIWVRRVG